MPSIFDPILSFVNAVWTSWWYLWTSVHTSRGHRRVEDHEHPPSALVYEPAPTASPSSSPHGMHLGDEKLQCQACSCPPASSDSDSISANESPLTRSDVPNFDDAKGVQTCTMASTSVDVIDNGQTNSSGCALHWLARGKPTSYESGGKRPPMGPQTGNQPKQQGR